MSKVSQELALRIGAEIELSDLSFSQLIQATKDLFDQEGLPGLIRFLIELIEKQMVSKIRQCPHCGAQNLHCHSRVGRRVKTSIGEILLRIGRYRCQACKKTSIPLSKVLDLDAYARKSQEFEKLALETVTDQSFRRSAKSLKETLGFKTAFSTLHRWFAKSDKDFGELSIPRQLEFIIADGTGFKKTKDHRGSNRGEVKVVVGIDQEGRVIPFGAWTQASWKNIAKLLKSKYNPSSKLKLKPMAKVLLSDGEEEIGRYLKKLASKHQRCLFHMTHELVPLMRYQEQAGLDEAVRTSEDLSKLIYLDLPQSNSEPLKRVEDKLQIEARLKSLGEELDRFIHDLGERGYLKAKKYIENAKGEIFTYVKVWLDSAIVSPKVTSLVERMMREIKRRIKKIGFAWSESGAQKMTRLVLMQLSSTKHLWENHWNEKMGTQSKIKLIFLGVDTKPLQEKPT